MRKRESTEKIIGYLSVRDEDDKSIEKKEKLITPQPETKSIFHMDYRLIKFMELPSFLQHNPHVVDGYRPALSITKAFQSIFHIHNETLNIWTHLLGALLFTVLMVHSLFDWLSMGTLIDKALFLIFSLSAQILLMCSTIFHTLYCTSKCSEEYGWFARLDFFGITLLITGSYYPPLYYLFKCVPLLGLFYISSLTILALVTICITFHPRFEKPENTKYRVMVFLFMGFFGIFVFPSAFLFHSYEVLFPVIWRFGVMGMFYCVGVLFYITRWPECSYPGKVDLTLHSHVIWHLFVIAGTISQYFVCKYCFTAQNLL